MNYNEDKFKLFLATCSQQYMSTFGDAIMIGEQADTLMNFVQNLKIKYPVILSFSILANID